MIEVCGELRGRVEGALDEKLDGGRHGEAPNGAGYAGCYIAEKNLVDPNVG